MAVAREVEAALNPVLTPAGFLDGARGVDDRNERGGVLFCIGHDEFGDRYPWAPQADAQKRGAGGCIDLMIETNIAPCRKPERPPPPGWEETGERGSVS